MINCPTAIIVWTDILGYFNWELQKNVFIINIHTYIWVSQQNCMSLPFSDMYLYLGVYDRLSFGHTFSDPTVDYMHYQKGDHVITK